jgi:hypothetical protein
MAGRAIDTRAKELIAQGDYLFGKKAGVLTLWQEIADNFYPERADFTMSRSLGTDFAGNLMTSYPILCRRELGSSLSGMLRPTEKEWFKQSVFREDRLDQAGKVWLEAKTKVQKRAMYDPDANFVRATREADNDFAAFGQAVITCELNSRRDALIFRCRHLRDVAWAENGEGKIDTIHDKHRMTARDLKKTFHGKQGAQIHPKVIEQMSKNPFHEFNIRRIVMPAEDFYAKPFPEGHPKFVSIYVDVDNGFIMEETFSHTKIYTIPRWQTVSGSQYAYSPCTVAALPDARLIQDMTRVLLEAGEKAVNPPMIAMQDKIRSDISIYAGGVTWTDGDHDFRQGDPMRPIPQDYSGIPLGIEMREDLKRGIMEAFYLNKLNMPQAVAGMTAYEISQRVQEYIRQALPLFEPMETDYNGSLCMDAWTTLFEEGTFGSKMDIPASLRGQNIQFQFESPLHDAVDRQKGHTFQEAKAMLAEAAALDTGVVGMVDVRKSLRDVLEGIGTPAAWIRSAEQMAEIDKANAEKQSQQEMLASMMQGGQVAEQVGKAGAALTSVQQPV